MKRHMKEHRLRVLLIEGDPDRVQLLEEAFGEMGELRFSRPTYPVCIREYALDWREALTQLRYEGGVGVPDAILLNISNDCAPSGPVAFAALRSIAPGAAIVLVASRGDEAAALALIRMGAQDYLIDAEIDCGPLGHTLRCAVERSRLEWSRQSVSMIDDLTGLYNLRGVAMLCERDRCLATALDLCRWSLELQLDPPAEADDADLRRLELAERLSELTPAGMAAGRVADDSFVLFGLAPTISAAASQADQAARQLAAQCAARGIMLNARTAIGGRARAVRESMS